MERTFSKEQQVKSISKRPKALAALKKGDKTVAEMAEIGQVSVARVREWAYGGAIKIEDGLCSLTKGFKPMDVDPVSAKGKAQSSPKKGVEKAPKKGEKKVAGKALKTAPRGAEKSPKKVSKKLGLKEKK